MSRMPQTVVVSSPLPRLLVLLAALSPATAAPPAADYPEASNRYAFAALSGLLQATPGNVGFSPFNSHQMAALILEGAQGSTLQELLTLTQLPADSATRLQWIDTIRSRLRPPPRQSPLTLESANALCAPPDRPFAPNFRQTMQAHFNILDITLSSNDPIQRSRQINRWISQQTRGRITDLASPQSLGADPHALALVNTLYLASNWSEPFDRAKTRLRPFTRPGGAVASLPTLLQTGTFPYAEEPDWQCLDLPFAARDFTLRLLLPRSEDQRTEIESGLTAGVWRELGTRLAPRKVALFLPRFAFSTQLNLKPLWEALGTRRVFVPEVADLTRLCAVQPCFLRGMIHATTIEVTETGAVASAATLAPADPFGSAPSAPNPLPKVVLFNADHPFLWFIVHRPTHLILFAGRFAGQSDD